MVEMHTFNSRVEWLHERKNKIGGSDAAAIIGLNPYKSNIDLWLEKTGQVIPEDISEKSYVKYGTEAEEHLRALFSLDFPEYQVEYVENNMFLNEKFPFAHASLDGWLIDHEGRKGVLEIKTTNIMQTAQKEKWKNRIPDNYYTQVLHCLMVTEFEFAILAAQLKYKFNGEIYKQTKHYKIERSEVETDIEYLENSERRFFEFVEKGVQPPLVLPAI